LIQHWHALSRPIENGAIKMTAIDVFMVRLAVESALE
jgi:hypothetical protein